MQQQTPKTMPPPPSTSPEPKIGTTLDGRYRLDALIGEGGGGQVYRATHLALDRPVAVKLLLQELEVSTVAKARFSREAKTLAALRHPNIVTVIDFGFGDFPFLVLELVQGCELEELVAEGALEIGDALSVMKQLLDALAYAHDAGVIHRDLKPSNLFVRQLPARLHVEVLDFGLAKFVEDETGSVETDIKVTRAGHIVGTPAYMAPEQITGELVDQRSDQYGATVVFFEMLTGKLPFDAPEVTGLLRAHLSQKPPALADMAPGPFSPELEAFIARGLAKGQDERFSDVPAMLRAMEVLPELLGSLAHPAGVSASGGADSGADAEEGVLEKAKQSVREISRKFVRHVDEARSDPAGVPAPPKALLIGTAVVLLLTLGYWIVSDDDSSADPSAPGAAVEVEVPEPLEELSDNPSADPWAQVPEELAAYKRRLDAGGRLRRREIGSLISFASEHPDDPRPLILRGQAYAARGSLSQALPYFLSAYETDIRARNDPKMLESLIYMATTEELEQEAADAIRQIYGDDARGPIAKAIGEQTESARRARLQRLAQTLD
ncbi:MAG: hypothetical protein ACI9KE_000554 [Polyangiales bacterium]|jgi:hypothetical protein